VEIDPKQLAHREFYRILINAVAPRPIAWVSTVSAEGQPNVAPFSFFNVVSAQPPLLGFSPAPRVLEAGQVAKDTLRNVRETREFVVNIVTYELAHAMNLTAGEYGPEVNEFELAGITMRASQAVRAPQVAESPVSFECKLERVLDFGDDPHSGHFVIGEIVHVHVADELMTSGKMDGQAMELIGRMGGLWYSRTRDRFEIARPKL